MNYLSSTWTFFYFCVVVFVVILEIFLAIFYPWPPRTIGNGIVLIFILFYFRKVKIIRYDHDCLYVRNMLLKEEKISMSEVYSLNIPDSWGDVVYELELRSGRIIQFVPTLERTMFIWQKPDVPDDVRQFQRVLNTFETAKK